LNAIAPSGDATGLRLALFSGNYNYTRDGANQALNRLVAFLLDAGAAVRVYSPTTDKPAFAPAGDLVSVPSIAAPGRPEYRVALGLPRRIREDIARFEPTAIHLSAPDPLNWGARGFARRLGLPVVASLHTRFETYLSYYGLGFLRPAAERYLGRFYGGCDQVLAPSRAMADLVQAQAPAARIRIWSRGIDRVQFSPSRRDLAWRRAAGVADHEIALLFLGRLVQEKGLDVLVATLSQLDPTLPVRVVVVGDGPAGPWLRSRLPNAIFAGFLTGDELGRGVASCDLFFNPSLTETFGNATVEAMASGLAVVAPDVALTREQMAPGRDGLLLPDPTPAAYAEAIAGLVVDPDRRKALGAAAARATQRFDWRACCAAVLDGYRELGALPGGVREAPAARRIRRTARVGA
jgi:glycosyltransferase involved in cell wall biosynthesis